MICRKNKPFLLKPAGKDYIWGGNRLNEKFGKGIELYPLAETWECSVHPDGESLVASGEFAGQKLADVLHKHPEFLGSHPGNELPILVKLIDAEKDLSVQVHPDDEYAALYENDNGKTEMWYVIDAEPGARLVYGFSREVSAYKVRRSIEDGTIVRYLNYIDVKKNDVFFIPAGTVHAICKGTLIAEIQQSSNLTYRLYDYGRPGKDGKPRPLHIDKALDVAILSRSDEPRQPIRIKRFRQGYMTEILGRCRYFQVERMVLNTEDLNVPITVETFSNSCRILLCTEGRGSLGWEGNTLEFKAGDCIFVPADSVLTEIKGSAQILLIGV